MEHKEEDVRLTITVPASLRRLLKVRAAENDRSFSGEVVRALKVGSGWADDKLAAGERFGDCAPAAGNENAALKRGASDHPRLEESPT